MLSGIAIVILLLIVSGLIAYIGDYLGRRIGKKRVSVFGLRPKHTSIIITIIAGVLIVSITLSVMFIFSSTARTSFFGLQRIISELRQQKAQLDHNRKVYKESVKQLEKKQSELDAILGEINQKTMDLADLRESQKKTAEEIKEMNRKMEALREKRDNLEKEIKETAQRLGDVSAETLYGDLLYKKGELLARATIAPDIQESELRTQLILTINTILSEAVRRGALVDEDTNIIFNEQFKSLKPVLQDAKSGLIIEVLAANNVFKGQQMYIKLHPIINRKVFEEGEVIIERRVAAGMTREQVDRLMSELLYKVSEEARQKGLLPDPETQRVGSISNKNYLKAVAQLTNLKIPKTARIIAVSETRVTDRLLIDVRVE